MRAELRQIVQPRLVIGVGKFAKASVLRRYPNAPELEQYERRLARAIGVGRRP